MEIRVWRSYSCNNSSSYYLVARFDDPKVVKDVAHELGVFFKDHAREVDAAFDDGEGDYPEGPSEAARALAKKYGFTWKSTMLWGDEMLAGDEPEVLGDDRTLVLYHWYCGGGLPAEIDRYLAARGGRVDQAPKDHDLSVSVVARLPSAGAKSALKKALDKLFAPMLEEEDDFLDGATPPWAPPKVRASLYGKAAYFCDDKTVGFFVPTNLREIDWLRAWLKKVNAGDPILRICEWADHEKFRVIAAARCTECGGPLEYLDPRDTQIESEQLMCSSCGGMFDLATFTAKRQAKKSASTPSKNTKKAATKKAATKKAATKKAATKKAATKKAATKKTATKKTATKKTTRSVR